MKQARRIIAVMLVLAMVHSACPAVGATDGTPALVEGVYEIYDVEQLYWFAEQVNTGNNEISGKLMENININASVLTEGGELNGDGNNFRVWTPIGTSDYIFKGSFDGNGKTVSGLYFNDATKDYVGLFGYCIDNVCVAGVGVMESYICGNNYVGGVVGYTRYGQGSAIDCYNTGTVKGNGALIGGVVGFGDAENCYNTGNINGSSTVGGVVGSGGTVNCYNAGNIIGGTKVGGIAGGIVGYQSKSQICDSYNAGDVVASGNYIGGLAGYCSENKLLRSYNSGNVIGDGIRAGGVVGYIYGVISNCYYTTGCAKDGNGMVQFGVGCYTLGGITEDVDGQTIAMGKAAFASGEVCYLLQQADSDAGWGQEIGVDASPVLGGATVYQASDCKGEAGGYSNIEGDTVHDYENAICVDCGECYRSGDIKWQLSSASGMEDAFTDLRLISFVDTLADYSKVVFTVSFADASGATRTVDLHCTTAYTELVANGASIGTADGIFGEGANYFVTYTIKEWPQAYFDTELTVIMTRYDLHGEVASVAARTFAVSDGM